VLYVRLLVVEVESLYLTCMTRTVPAGAG